MISSYAEAKAALDAIEDPTTDEAAKTIAEARALGDYLIANSDGYHDVREIDGRALIRRCRKLAGGGLGGLLS